MTGWAGSLDDPRMTSHVVPTPRANANSKNNGTDQPVGLGADVTFSFRLATALIRYTRSAGMPKRSRATTGGRGKRFPAKGIESGAGCD
ncbi:MAG: hypothetical protein H0W66_09655 [Chthoniobacterales bacterium]|nr:hypothetical protein [Chthoniobacterales bacterium]